MRDFNELKISDIRVNPFEEIGNSWMLVTAKKENAVNTMTASWGALGIMWGKPVSFIGIRPQRYTKEFVDFSDEFSICFFDESYKDKLEYLGKVSGRHENKIDKSGLTLIDYDNIPIFAEAKLAFICKKLYSQSLAPNCFIDINLDNTWYKNKDYHTIYISEIIKAIEK